jgi:hypothetical protein
VPSRAMKYPIVGFKSLKEALKELEPFIRNGKHLQTGKPFKKFGGMRSREKLANWLLCVAINATDNRTLTFSSDPLGGDGIICDPATDETWPTEHVMVPRLRPGQTGDCEALILKAIEQKRSKGGASAAGKTLIVFLEAGGGIWFPNKVARQLPNPLLFAAAWVVGLHGVSSGEYVYNVTCLDISDGDAPAVSVRVGKDFDSWTVNCIQ